MGMIDQLEEIYLANLNVYEKTEDVSLGSDKSIIRVSMEAKKLRFLAAAEIRLHGDVSSFRFRIDRAVRLKMLLMNAYDKGLPVSASYVTMKEFSWGLDACAAGDNVLARSFLELLGGRESRRDSGFISSLGYAVKELIMNGTCSSDRLRGLKESCVKPSFAGYAQLIEGISHRDVGQSEAAIIAILKGHKTSIRPGGFFALSPDEIVCFWAIGLLNFSASQGMKISIPENDILPRVLLLPVQ